MSKSPTQVIDDIRAFARSSITTAVALTVTITGFCATLVPIVPDEYDQRLIATGAAAASIGTILRQAYAWLDPKNTSFGRVRVTVDEAAPPPDPEADATQQDDLAVKTDNGSRPDDGPQDISQDPGVEIESEVPDEPFEPTDAEEGA